MLDSLMYGSLVLYATTPVQEFPRLVNANTIKGFHLSNKFKGAYSFLTKGNFEEVEIHLPTRNKHLTVTALSEHENYTKTLTFFYKLKLQEIDSLFEGARHLYKMQQMMDEVHNLLPSRSPYLICVANNSQHSYFTLLSSGVELHVYGVYDTVNKSVRLVWTNDPQFVNSCRDVEPTRYVFYRYPTLVDRPLFLYTPVLCSKWAEWTKIFTGPDGILKAFNALELFLYKDSQISSFDTSQGT